MINKSEKFLAVKKGSIHDLVLQILLNSKKPMKVAEITEKVLKLKKIKSKTPGKTISSVLQKSTFVKSDSKHGHYTILKKPVFVK